MSKRDHKRTEWSEDRTLLASERTFSSWTGTGLGAVGVSIGLNAVFSEIEPDWPIKIVATVFLATALLLYWYAYKQACKTRERLSETDAATQSSQNFATVAALSSVGTIGVGMILWAI